MKLNIGQFLAIATTLPIFMTKALFADGDRRSRHPMMLNWQAFLDCVERQARKQSNPSWDQQAYVEVVARLIGHLRLDDLRLSNELAAARDLRSRTSMFEELHRSAEFQVSLITFEPGDFIPHHDHPAMTGVLACASGRAEVCQYDFLKSAPSSGAFLKPRGKSFLRPGQVSTLTARVCNVHSVRAESFTQLLDIFTPPYNEERQRKTHWYRIQQEREGFSSKEIFATPL